MADEEAARAALKALAEQEQKKAAVIAETNAAEVDRLQAEIARLKALLEDENQNTANGLAAEAALTKLQAELKAARAAAEAAAAEREAAIKAVRQDVLAPI